ncbi:hypothetical protein, partial [Nocardiopsis composta]|uniref:hypothetical protein n=1 Tax=Nocardiopsis composta TaxID=157465 RepID=UPI003B3AE530
HGGIIIHAHRNGEKVLKNRNPKRKKRAGVIRRNREKPPIWRGRADLIKSETQQSGKRRLSRKSSPPEETGPGACTR